MDGEVTPLGQEATLSSDARRNGDLVLVVRVSRRAAIAGAAIFALALVLATPVIVRALPPVSYPVTLPHSFSNGAIADATEVNDNFVAIRDAINDLDLRLSAVQSTFTSTSNLMVFGTPGTSQFTVPAGVTRILIEAWGGGGGNVGGGGGYGADFFSVTAGQVLSIGVGSGGSGNADGGSTQIILNGSVVLLATGGTYLGNGGTGGSSGARLNVTGSTGQPNPNIPGFASRGTIGQSPGGSGSAGRVVIWY